MREKFTLSAAYIPAKTAPNGEMNPKLANHCTRDAQLDLFLPSRYLELRFARLNF